MPPSVHFLINTRNVPKFSDRQVIEEQSDQGLHCLEFPLHLLDVLLLKKTPSCSAFRVITIKFRVSEILGFLR